MSRFGNKLSFLAAVGALLLICDMSADPTYGQEPGSVREPASAYVVDLSALDYAFAMPLEIPSGWITFRMENMGQEEHLALVAEVADSLTLEQVQRLIRNDEWEGLWDEWAAGVGILSPDRTALTTVHLEPGVHLMFCTINTPDGESHAANGMVLAFKVTEEVARSEKPKADIEITVANYSVWSSGHGLVPAGNSEL